MRARDFNHSSHSLSAVGLSPLLLAPPSREETTASLSYASPCVIVVVVVVSSFKRSVSFRHAFRRWLYSSFTGSLALDSLPCLCLSASLRPRSLLSTFSCAWLSALSHLYPFISSIDSLTISPLLGCVFLPSASLRTRKYSSLFHLYVCSQSHQASISLSAV